MALASAAKSAPPLTCASNASIRFFAFALKASLESCVRISVCPWVKVPDYDAAISEVNKAILELFAARNIALALPQYEVRMLDGAA